MYLVLITLDIATNLLCHIELTFKLCFVEPD